MTVGIASLIDFRVYVLITSRHLSLEVGDLCHYRIPLKVMQQGSEAWTRLIEITH